MLTEEQAEEIYGTTTIKNKLKRKEYNLEKMVTTSDDWCPNFPGNKIEVGMLMYDGCENEVLVKVIAWGMDDTGVELEFMTNKSDYGYFEADRVWNQWKNHIYDKVPENVDMEWFLDRGFLWG